MKPRTNVIWGFVALCVAMLLVVASVRANDAQPTERYSFGLNALPVTTQNFGSGYKVGSLECKGSAEAQGIRRGDELVYVEVRAPNGALLSEEEIRAAPPKNDGRIAVVTIARGGKLADRATLMLGRIHGNNKC